MSDGAFAVMGIGQAIGRADDWLRGQAARRGQQARMDQIMSVMRDLDARTKPGGDLTSPAKSIGAILGVGDSEIPGLIQELQGPGREALIRRAAKAQQPGFVQQVNRVLSGTGPMDRAGQVGIYGAIGGGGVMGGVALTEAGQQLLALIRYAEETEDTAAKREEAPIA